MAVLSATDRQRVKNYIMRNVSSDLGVTKPDLQAAIDATDQWIEDNQSTFNSAIPVAARTAMNTNQKTLMFCFVAMRRAGLLTVQEDQG